MEVYILDSLLRRVQVIDKYESLIWTERFDEVGDFEIILQSNRGHRETFREGTHVALNKSMRVMTVESVEDGTDDDNRLILKVRGRSLESLMEDRVAKETLQDTTADPTWDLYNTPGNIARYVFDEICRVGRLSLLDKIPFITPGTIFPASTIPESDVPIRVMLKPKSVKETVQDICKSYDLGYRLVRNFDQSQLYFDIYSGNDLTTRQIVRPSVIFSFDNDNLQNAREFSSIEKSKNVAYVISERGTRVVYGDLVPEDVDGFDRRVMLVEASNIDEDTIDVQDALLQEGKAALAKQRAYAAFDGEISQSSDYLYGRDYGLGDIVELRNKDGITTYKRVTEQIFVEDAEGERAYPTLSMSMFVSQNTWLSQTDKKWVDYGPTEYWNTQ